MKKSILLLVSLIIMMTPQLTSAEDIDHSEGVNPEPGEVKELISGIARKYGIPPEILKAIASEETNYKQYTEKGELIISNDGGIGIMQVTPENIDVSVDIEKLKTNIAYNIEISAKVLLNKWNLSYLPDINNRDKAIMEDWYFAIMAYNGLSKRNDPNINPGDTYQGGVYERIATRSLVYGPPFEFPTFDIRYDSGKDTMIFPPNTNYSTETITPSQQMYESGDMVYVDERDGYANLRKGGSVITKLWPYTPLEITGSPVEDPKSTNDFVYYPVKGVKAEGFVSSAYLNKGTEDMTFSDPMDDNRAAALAFAAMNGYVEGYPTGELGSSNPLKREHVAVILNEVLKLTMPSDYQIKADDVSEKSEYYEQLAKAEYNGLMGAQGKLRPKEHLTRSQMAVVMTNAFSDYYEKPDKPHKFKDQEHIWNPEDVQTLYHNNITVADPFRPNDDITRSQFAIFIYRTLVDVK